MNKGITPVISIILLLVMTIAVAGLFFIFSESTQEEIMGGVEKSIKGKVAELSSCISIDSISGNLVYLRNCGKGVIPEETIIVYIDGKPVETFLDETIGEGEVGVLTLSSRIFSELEKGKHNMEIRGGDLGTKVTKVITLENDIITILSDGSFNQTLTFSGGESQMINLEIPNGSKIIKATFRVTGLPL